MSAQLEVVEAPKPLKLDLGCGPNPREGFIGVDARQFGCDGVETDGKVDVIHDLRTDWPWKDGSVEEVHSSHFLEHLTGAERVWIARFSLDVDGNRMVDSDIQSVDADTGEAGDDADNAGGALGDFGGLQDLRRANAARGTLEIVGTQAGAADAAFGQTHGFASATDASCAGNANAGPADASISKQGTAVGSDLA